MDWLCGLTDRKDINKNFTTYTDVIDFLFNLMNIGVLEDYPISKYEITLNRTAAGIWGIFFTDKYLTEFLADWAKMRNLSINGTIDDEVYSLWREKTIKKYNFKIHPSKINEDTPQE